jgi:hypothetical protein
MFRIAAALLVAGLGVVLLLSGSGAAGQDKELPIKIRGQLPPGWKKIGLSDEQVQRVYKIQGQYKSKINKLEAEIKLLRAEEKAEMFRVLTDDQKTKLRQLIEGKLIEPDTKDKKIEDKRN